MPTPHKGVLKGCGLKSYFRACWDAADMHGALLGMEKWEWMGWSQAIEPLHPKK